MANAVAGIVRARVIALMAAKGVSAAALARSVRRTPTWASMFLAGKRGVHMGLLAQIAQAFDEPIYSLFLPPSAPLCQTRTGESSSDRPSESEAPPHATPSRVLQRSSAAHAIVDALFERIAADVSVARAALDRIEIPNAARKTAPRG